ncbi:tyrosine-type recombinase/integrase [Alkalihalobacillus sp. TS-13]|uniref:tyrosine-type recombinase/integrase n=1 Tax=Alkalihalobacillus sp. TS-13 TaxID=2842455 RepID=UPI001C88BE64|nr:tyrosine-type recombinase/integrase [Alkalihalobacillus sp. TS-13]
MNELQVINEQYGLIRREDFLREDLYIKISEHGFQHTNWSKVPDELLVYLFLHDSPILNDKRSINTKKEYLRDVNHFMKFTESRGGLRSLVPEEVEAYQNQVANQYRPSTTRKKSTVVKQFLTYLYKKGVLQQDLTTQMKKTAVPKKQLVNRDLHEHEVIRLLEHFKQTDWFGFTIWFTLVSTGMRIEEVANAEWNKLYFDHEVGAHILYITGKGEKVRPVVIYDEVLAAVKELRLRRGFSDELYEGDSSPFLPKPNGRHYTAKYLSKEVTNLIQATKDKFPFIEFRENRITPHTARHYYAEHLSSRNVEIKAIKEALGHSSIVTTNNYLRRKNQLKDHAGLKVGKNFF